MAVAEQWKSLSSDASPMVSKINSYRKLTPSALKVGGKRWELCYSKFSTGDVGADQYMVKCLSCTFIMFDSDDNIICAE